MVKIRNTIVALALLAFAPLGLAAVIAEDDFTYPLGEINSQNGGSGWSGSWTAATNVTHVVDPAVDLNGARALQITDNNDNAAYRQLASPFTGNALFVDFLVQVDAGALTFNDFLAFWMDTVTTDAHTGRPNIGFKADEGDTSSTSPNPTNDVFVRTTGTAGSFAPGSNIGSINDVTRHIVGRLSRSSPGSYTKFDLWLDPIFGDLSSPDATFTGSAGISQITHVGLRAANLDSGDVVLVDRLRLSTTWNDALRVPEPATLALIGLSLVIIAGLRRCGQGTQSGVRS